MAKVLQTGPSERLVSQQNLPTTVPTRSSELEPSQSSELTAFFRPSLNFIAFVISLLPSLVGNSSTLDSSVGYSLYN